MEDLNERMEELNRQKKFMDRLSIINNLLGVGVKTIDHYPVVEPPKLERRRQTTVHKQTKVPGSRVDREAEESRFDERLRQVIYIICSKRKRLQFDVVYRRATDLIQKCNLKIEKGKENMMSLIVYSIIVSCRINGIYLDPQMMASELGICPKKFGKYVFRYMPAMNSQHWIDIQVIDSFIRSASYDIICDEYTECVESSMIEILGPGFRFTGDDAEQVKQNFSCHMSSLTEDSLCDDERQFCVTSNKIIIYTLFEYVRDKRPELEKSISLAFTKLFLIPKVTIDKMKRIIVKCRKRKALASE